MNLPRFATRLCFALALGTISVGCTIEKRRYDKRREVIRQSEELSRDYLRGDVRHARECLLNEVKLLEEATVVETSGRAQLLAKTYSRLCVLEKRTGNGAAAEANLIKARYWLLTYGELTGIPVDNAMAQLKQFDPGQIVEFVDGFDMRHNDGKEPKYLEFLKLGDVQKPVH
jgi:hypothetical protein